MDWIENIILTDEMKQSIEEKLKIINENLGANFTANTPFLDVLEAISEKWNSV